MDQTENIFADDWAKALAVSREHLGVQMKEVVGAAIEFFAPLADKKRDGFIRARLSSKSGQAIKNVKLADEDRARAEGLRQLLPHVARVVMIGAALDAFARASFDRRQALFRERHARRQEPVPA